MRTVLPVLYGCSKFRHSFEMLIATVGTTRRECQWVERVTDPRPHPGTLPPRHLGRSARARAAPSPALGCGPVPGRDVRDGRPLPRPPPRGALFNRDAFPAAGLLTATNC